MKVRTITNFNGGNPQRYVKAEIAESLLAEFKALFKWAHDSCHANFNHIPKYYEDKLNAAGAAIKKAEE